MLPSSLVQGFLAAGPTVGQLPYPIMPHSAQRIVRAALRHAWKVVQAKADEHGLGTASEPQITTMLQFALNELLDDDSEPVPGFSSNFFETVERGAEMVNYNGVHPEKRPDLRFRLHGRIRSIPDRTHYGLFAECKLLDATHSLGLYASKGILRFVNGEYAWAMPHGLMVGYIRAGGPTRADLTSFLNDRNIAYGVMSVAETAGDDEQLVESRHKRPWQYPTSGSDPGPIDLVHVWLSVA